MTQTKLKVCAIPIAINMNFSTFFLNSKDSKDLQTCKKLLIKKQIKV